jgi:hypothetical protein
MRNEPEGMAKADDGMGRKLASDEQELRGGILYG